jgi:hypothetical protein
MPADAPGVARAVSPLALTLPAVRLDQALLSDLRRALASRAILVFLGLELAAGLVFVARRGPAVTETVLLVWLGLGILAFFCWWAGRHRAAHPEPDQVPRARPRLACALGVAVGLSIGTYAINAPLGAAITIGSIAGWLMFAVRRDSAPGLGRMLIRDWRPFVPLLLLVALPRIALLGPASLLGLTGALPSGIGQQLLFLVMLYVSIEAVTRRMDVAAVLSALVFAVIHVPMNLPANEMDWIASIANALFYQATVGIIACLAFTRHRAPVPIGVAHAMAIA